MKKITRQEYDKLSPKTQGYISYMQGAWNEGIPDLCHYPRDSKKALAWYEGMRIGILESQDSDE